MSDKQLFPILVANWGTVNFDKMVYLAHALSRKLAVTCDDVVFVTKLPPGAEPFLDIEGEPEDREYWKSGYRSMTEKCAIRAHYLTADMKGGIILDGPNRGLALLCQALAETHGKVPGVKGGGLYKERNGIPMFARNLAVVPGRAPEIAKRVLKAVIVALATKDPVRSLFDQVATGNWHDVDQMISQAEYAVSQRAERIANSFRDDSSDYGYVFPLEHLPDQDDDSKTCGIVLRTDDPNIAKHLWAKFSRFNDFNVPVMIVAHPTEGRVAILTSNLFRLDLHPLVDELMADFREAEFDINHDRQSIVFDPRFSRGAGPDAEQAADLVGAHLRRQAAPARPARSAPDALNQPPRTTLGDRVKLGKLKPNAKR